MCTQEIFLLEGIRSTNIPEECVGVPALVEHQGDESLLCMSDEASSVSPQVVSSPSLEAIKHTIILTPWVQSSVLSVWIS